MFRLCRLLAACLTITVLLPQVALGAEPGSAEAKRASLAVSKLGAAPALELYAPGALEARQQPRLERFIAEHSDRWEVRWDARSDRPHLIQGPGIPLWPVKDGGLAPQGLRLEQVERRLRKFLTDQPELFGISPADLRLDRRRSYGSGRGLWLIELEQVHGGLPVVGARVFLRVNHGRLVQFGSHALAEVELDLEPGLTAEEAFDLASRAFGQKLERLADRGLAIYPAAAGPPGEPYRGAPGHGVRHRLAWRLTAGAGDGAYHLVVDAQNGELLESRSLTHSLGQVSGEVAQVGRDRPPEEVPFPWALVWNAGAKYTDTEGTFGYQGGTALTKLEGIYVTVDDGCGPLLLASSDGLLDFGTGGGDCQTPGFGGSGNTLAARTAYYYLSRAQERASTLFGMAAGPLGDGLIARTNLHGDSCGAFYNAAAGTVDFQRSASGCTNPGELPGILFHEWGHAVFDQAGGAMVEDGASAEAAADTFSFLETGEPCIGDGFRPGVPCRNCSPSCTGVRDLAAFAFGGGGTLARPDTVEDDQGLDCDRLGCPYLGAGAEQYQGPMGYQAHCESQIASSANWDLAQRLMAANGPERGWQVMTELWYHSLAATGSAYRKVPAAASCHPAQDAVDGCGAGNWYTLLLAVDDDDGDLANGTPNACLIWQAFDAHGIACGAEPPCSCAQPAVADAGPERAACAGEPVQIGTPARPGHTYSWSPIDRAPGGRNPGEPPAEGWDQAQVVAAPAATTVYTVVATTACGSASDQVTVTVHDCDAPFDGDFAAGGIGWQTSGLWHLAENSACAAPGHASPTGAMYYGQDASCDYDTGGANSGELISPWIDGITGSSHLVFEFARAVELGAFDRDRAEVAITAFGSSDWDPRWARDAIDPSTGAWTSAGPISLAPYAGQRIQVRFRFDTRDGEANARPGWLVDDVAVVKLEPPTGGAPPEITLLDPLPESTHEACTCVPVSAYANDVEDGDLAAIVRWSSDRDGPIGAGRSLAAALSVGDHVLSASVTDHSGLTTTRTVSVTVEPADGCDLSEWPPASPELFCGGDE